MFEPGLAGTTVFHSIPPRIPPFHHCYNLIKQAKRAIIPIQKCVSQTAECGVQKNISLRCRLVLIWVRYTCVFFQGVKAFFYFFNAFCCVLVCFIHAFPGFMEKVPYVFYSLV